MAAKPTCAALSLVIFGSRCLGRLLPSIGINISFCPPKPFAVSWHFSGSVGLGRTPPTLLAQCVIRSTPHLAAHAPLPARARALL